MIDAFALAAARGAAARLMILGEGPERPDLEARIRRAGLSGAVRLAGFQLAPLRFIARAKLLVLPSRYEGFGNVLVEALGCGTPVVSTDCPHGPSEILDGGRHGRLVQVGDADGMAGAILASLEETADRTALRAHAARFSLGVAAAAYASLFDEVRARRATT